MHSVPPGPRLVVQCVHNLDCGFPLGTRPLSSGVGLTLSYSAGGGAAFARFGVPTGGFASVTALSGGSPPPAPFAPTVIRTK